MNNSTLLSAGLAALLPTLALQACSVDATGGDNTGVSPDEIVEVDDSCEVGELRFCDQTLDPTLPGEQSCIEEAEVTGWTGCAPRQMNGPEDCNPGERWDGERCVVEEGSSTPIVLSFTGEAVGYTSGGGDFDLTGRGYNVMTDWPRASTPWLALDRDANGRIDSGAELFGSATRLATGRLARHGFEALRELDTDHDNALTAHDTAFSSLRLWADANGDRISQPDELTTLAEAGVSSISLDMGVQERCDVRNNCERERASFTFESAGEQRQGAAIDVHLAWQ